MTKIKIFFIIFAIFLGLLVRLNRIDSPIADWHSFRQVDTLSVTRNFLNIGINMLIPTYHDLSNLQSGIDNPQGYRMVEFPVYNLISAGFSKIFNINPEISSRLVSIFLSLGSSLIIFFICHQQTKLFWASLLPMLVFLFLPFNIYYSRTTLPEPTAVFFMLLGLYLFKINLLFSAISLSLSILIKPYTAIISLPTLIFFTRNYYSKNLTKKNILLLLFFAVITIFPFILWRQWILQFPSGIPKSNWLLNNSDSTTFPNWYHGYNLTFLNKLVAFRPHWFYWLFKERLATLILGTFGIIPAFLGLAYKKGRTQIFSLTIILGILLYFIIIAQGNIQHDYYQVLIIPGISIITGFGFYYIFNYIFSNKFWAILSILIILIMSFYFSWNLVKGYYQINNPRILTAGAKAKEILPSNSLVIAPYSGDTALLYQTGFSGWPIEVYDIEKLINLFPNNNIYLVSVNYDQYTNSLIPKYQTVIKDKDFIILKLTL